MTHPREEMACSVCLSPLNTLNGDYIHPLHHDDDGHQPVPIPIRQLDTVHRTCDFCGDLYPMWTLRGGDVAVLASTSQAALWQNFGQTWTACVPCLTDLDAGRPHRAADRALQRMGLRNVPSAHADITRLHRAFLDQRQPGRALITTTAWPDLHLGPRDLPKIRDRLAQFYRGHDELPTSLPITPTMRRQLTASLDRSRLYWVDDSFTDLAEHAAAQLPAVTASRDLAPCDDGLLVWSRSVTDRRVTAASWSMLGDGILIVLYRAIGGGLDDQPMQRLRGEVGWLAPMRTCHLSHDQPIAGGDGHPASVALAIWLLIAQKAAETPPTEIDKSTRKNYARTQRPLPDVRIVRIRANIKPDATTAPATKTRTGRTYTNRVWVTGHWRNQAYGPGRALRRPVYIHPFLRGPDDAPIMLSTTVRILDSRGASEPENGATE